MAMRFVGLAPHRDPTTFIGAFAMWALMCGMSLVLPGDVFGQVQSYNLMEYVYPHELRWGYLMIVNGVLLVASLFTSSIAFRCAIAGGSAALWTFCGVLMCVASYQAGWFSIVGGYSLWGALGCLVAIEQWIRHAGD